MFRFSKLCYSQLLFSLFVFLFWAVLLSGTANASFDSLIDVWQFDNTNLLDSSVNVVAWPAGTRSMDNSPFSGNGSYHAQGERGTGVVDWAISADGYARSAWIKLSSSGNPGDFWIWNFQHTGKDDEVSYRFGNNAGTTGINFVVNDITGGCSSTNYEFTQDFYDDVYRLWTMNISSSTTKIYINDELWATCNHVNSISFSGDVYNQGGFNKESEYDGAYLYYSDMAFYDKPLTIQEITGIYESGESVNNYSVPIGQDNNTFSYAGGSGLFCDLNEPYCDAYFNWSALDHWLSVVSVHITNEDLNVDERMFFQTRPNMNYADSGFGFGFPSHLLIPMATSTPFDYASSTWWLDIEYYNDVHEMLDFSIPMSSYYSEPSFLTYSFASSTTITDPYATSTELIVAYELSDSDLIGSQICINESSGGVIYPTTDCAVASSLSGTSSILFHFPVGRKWFRGQFNLKKNGVSITNSNYFDFTFYDDTAEIMPSLCGDTYLSLSNSWCMFSQDVVEPVANFLLKKIALFFPFNVIDKIKKSWIASETAELPASLAFLDVADEGGNLSVAIPDKFSGTSSSSIKIFGSDVFSSGGSTLPSFFAGMRSFTTYLFWMLFLMTGYKYARNLYNKLKE